MLVGSKALAIVGGQSTTIQQHPWQVYLEITKPSSLLYNGYSTWCGGSIISSSYILTARHCVCHGSFRYFNEFDECITENNIKDNIKVYTGIDDSTGKIPSNLSRVDNYAFAPDDLDAVLLHLETPIEFSDVRKSIDYRAAHLDNSLYAQYRYVSASGWGLLNDINDINNDINSKPNKLQVLENRLQIIPEAGSLFDNPVYIGIREYMEEHYYGSPYGVNYLSISVHPPSLDEGISHGDSGGPITTKSGNNEEVLIGVISSNKVYDTLRVATFLKVSCIYDWIEKYVHPVIIGDELIKPNTDHTYHLSNETAATWSRAALNGGNAYNWSLIPNANNSSATLKLTTGRCDSIIIFAYYADKQLSKKIIACDSMAIVGPDSLYTTEQATYKAILPNAVCENWTLSNPNAFAFVGEHAAGRNNVVIKAKEEALTSTLLSCRTASGVLFYKNIVTRKEPTPSIIGKRVTKSKDRTAYRLSNAQAAQSWAVSPAEHFQIETQADMKEALISHTQGRCDTARVIAVWNNVPIEKQITFCDSILGPNIIYGTTTYRLPFLLITAARTWNVTNTDAFEISNATEYSVMVKAKQEEINDTLKCIVDGVTFKKYISSGIKKTQKIIEGPSFISINSTATYTLEDYKTVPVQWSISDTNVFKFNNTNATTITATSVTIKGKQGYASNNLFAVYNGRTIKKTISIYGKKEIDGFVGLAKNNDTINKRIPIGTLLVIGIFDVCIYITDEFNIDVNDHLIDPIDNRIFPVRTWKLPDDTTWQLTINYPAHSKELKNEKYRTMRLVLKDGVYIESITEAGADKFKAMLIEEFGSCEVRCNAPFEQDNIVQITQEGLRALPIHEEVKGFWCIRDKLYFYNRNAYYLALEKLPAQTEYRVIYYDFYDESALRFCHLLKQNIRRKPIIN
jgi:hypothetical protein